MKLFNETLLSNMLDYIRKYQIWYGQSPTLRKIKDDFPAELTSVSKVERYVNVLAIRGLIEREGGRIHMKSNISSRGTVSAPLVGYVACGNPTFAIEDIEQTFHLPIDLFGNCDVFMLRAKGESMASSGISDGDLIVVRKQDYAEYGQKVVALIGDEATVKTFRPDKNKVILHPENAEFEDIVVKRDECMIQGIVVGCIKVFH